MALKGHATIELTNIETGEKRVIEEDNIVTKAVEEYVTFLKRFGRQNGILSESSLVDPAGNVLLADFETAILEKKVKHLFGGLLLFDTPIEENVNVIYPPEGINITGLGSYVGYSGTNYCAGSFIETESGEIDNGYKLVWDFGTSYGNGQIACVCLAPAVVGKVGFGSYPLDDSSAGYFAGMNLGSNKKPCENFISHSNFYNLLPPMKKAFTTEDMFLIGSHVTHMIFGFNYNEDYVDCFADIDEVYMNYSSDSYFSHSLIAKRGVTLRRVRLNEHTFSVLENNSNDDPYIYNKDSTNVTYKAYGETQEKIRESYTIKEQFVEMPDNLKAIITDEKIATTGKEWGFARSFDDEYLYIIILDGVTRTDTRYIDVGEQFYVWRIKKSDYSSDGFIVTNTTGLKIATYRIDSMPYVINDSQSAYSALDDVSIYVCRGKVFAESYVLYGGNANDKGKMFIIDLYDSTNVTELTFSDSGKPIPEELSDVDPSNQGGNYHRFFYYAGRLTFQYKGFYQLIYDFTSQKLKFLNGFNGSNSVNDTYSFQSNLKTFYCADDSGLPLSIIPWDHQKYSNKISISHTKWFLSTINNLSSPVVKTSAETMKITYTLTNA